MSVVAVGSAASMGSASMTCVLTAATTGTACGITAWAAQGLHATITHMTGSVQPSVQQGEAARAAAAPYCRTTNKAITMARRRRMAQLYRSSQLPRRGVTRIHGLEVQDGNFRAGVNAVSPRPAGRRRLDWDRQLGAHHEHSRTHSPVLRPRPGGALEPRLGSRPTEVFQPVDGSRTRRGYRSRTGHALPEAFRPGGGSLRPVRAAQAQLAPLPAIAASAPGIDA